MTLKMASAQVVETSVTNNSPSQDSYHPDDLFQSRYKLQYEYGFDIKLRNKIRFHLSLNGQRHYISLKK